MIHPSAIISPEASLHPSVEVGPFSIIEDGVTMGAGCKVDAQAKVCRGVTMGENNSIGYGAVIGGDPQDLTFDPKTDSGVSIGNGNTFREYVSIHRSTVPQGQTVVGDENFMMATTHLAHDVIMGDHNVLANNAMVAGHVQMGSHIFMGGGAGYHQFIYVGDYSIIQGNGGATKDVPPYCIVHGINQLSGLNIVGLRRAKFGPELRKEIKAAYRTLFQGRESRAASLAIIARQKWSDEAMKLIDAVRLPSKKGILSR